jgi:hypothetical protein
MIAVMATFVYSDQSPVKNSLVDYSTFKKRFLRGPAHFCGTKDLTSTLGKEVEDGISKREDFFTHVPVDKDCYHNGVIDYLYSAWRADCGIEISPWLIWNLIISVFAEVVKKNEGWYRKYFTRANTKTKLEFMYSDVIGKDGNLKIDLIFKEIKNHAPIMVDFDTFIPSLPSAPPLK